MNFLTVNDLLSYDPNTGEFRWKKQRGSMVAGSVAGGFDTDGYRVISIGYKKQRAHRIAWLLFHGRLPEGHLDHINGCKDDNRISNLRVVTPAENEHAKFKPTSRSKTGFRGVDVHQGLFRASINVAGKQSFLGYFSTPEAAHAAYLAAKDEVQPASRAARPHHVLEAA